MSHTHPKGEHAARTRFGEVAVDLGLLSAEQLDRALQAQQELAVIGQHRRLGEILVEQHVLELRGVQKVLREQQRLRQSHGDASAEMARSVAGFEILEVLGAGGMGKVYKARDPESGRIVALKVLSRRLLEDNEFVARFEREVKAAGSLSHPNIVKSLTSGEDNGRPYLVMEYVDGQNLGRLMDTQRRLPEKQALEIARDVALGLEHAHSQGVVHRDVKPDNVLIDRAGRAKLTDFGLAKLLRDDQRLTQTGIALGTPHYISPEQIAASRYIDHRSDQYSLGAMLYFMLAGRVPFDGTSNNDIMLRHLEDTAADPRQWAPEISVEAVCIVAKLMARKASERYDTTAQVVEDLQRVLRSDPPLYAHAEPYRPVGYGQVKREKTGCALAGLLIIAVAWFIK